MNEYITMLCCLVSPHSETNITHILLELVHSLPLSLFLSLSPSQAIFRMIQMNELLGLGPPRQTNDASLRLSYKLFHLMRAIFFH